MHGPNCGFVFVFRFIQSVGIGWFERGHFYSRGNALLLFSMCIETNCSCMNTFWIFLCYLFASFVLLLFLIHDHAYATSSEL